MTRLKQLLAHIDTTKSGIEVAPYTNPVFPKMTYPNVLTLDVFDTQTLRMRAHDDPHIPSEKIVRIEDVDIVGDASSIGALVSEKGLAGKIGFVVSCHNFEHLPNPIRFLRGCSDVLEPGGVLSMAVPDARACFDIFRMPTRLVEWLTAYHENRSQPSREILFDFASNAAEHVRFGVSSPSVPLNVADPSRFRLGGDLRDSYATFVQTLDRPGEYRDAHCSVMFPETLELMLRDLRYLGLIDLDLIEVSQTRVSEFFVHLRKTVGPATAIDKTDHLAKRQALAARINASIGSVVYRRQRYLPHLSLIPSYSKAAIKWVIGDERYARLSSANRARRFK